MSDKLNKIIKDFKHQEYGSMMDPEELDVPEIKLYAADCGGYDITGALQLQIKDGKIRLVRCDFDDEWVEVDSVELIEKE